MICNSVFQQLFYSWIGQNADAIGQSIGLFHKDRVGDIPCGHALLPIFPEYADVSAKKSKDRHPSSERSEDPGKTGKGMG